MPISKKRLAEIEAMPDDAIDTSDIPEVDEAFFRRAKLVMPRGAAASGARAHVAGTPIGQIHVPAVSVTYARNGRSTKANELGMRPMQERAYEKRGEQYLLIKSPPASGKSRALMFIALDKLAQSRLEAGDHRRAGEVHRRQLQRRAAVQVRLLGRLAVEPKWNLCNAPGDGQRRQGQGGRARSSTATTRCWSAPTRPSASPWTSSGSRHSTIG